MVFSPCKYRVSAWSYKSDFNEISWKMILSKIFVLFFYKSSPSTSDSNQIFPHHIPFMHVLSWMWGGSFLDSWRSFSTVFLISSASSCSCSQERFSSFPKRFQLKIATNESRKAKSWMYFSRSSNFVRNSCKQIFSFQFSFNQCSSSQHYDAIKCLPWGSIQQSALCLVRANFDVGRPNSDVGRGGGYSRKFSSSEVISAEHKICRPSWAA